jgi:putative transcriptional regulator
MDALYIGGPVLHEVLLLLLRSQVSLQPADQVLDKVYFSQSFDMLAALLKDNRPKDAFRVYAGYAGWAPRQLQAEFDRGDWRIVQGDPDIVFIQDPAEVWTEMIRRSSEQLIKNGNRLYPLTALE